MFPNKKIKKEMKKEHGKKTEKKMMKNKDKGCGAMKGK
jgi:hypothetical protein